MKRIALSDGGWFDAETAVEFQESTWWNGSNHISAATQDQWLHEKLFFTRGGTWVLNCWSQWQGTPERYSRITERKAVAWLISQGHSDLEKLLRLPEKVRASVLEGIAGQEV